MQDIIKIHDYCKKFESCECCRFAQNINDMWLCRFMVKPSDWAMIEITTACSELFYMEIERSN